jgi:hypothetical protein
MYRGNGVCAEAVLEEQKLSLIMTALLYNRLLSWLTLQKMPSHPLTLESF